MDNLLKTPKGQRYQKDSWIYYYPLNLPYCTPYLLHPKLFPLYWLTPTGHHSRVYHFMKGVIMKGVITDIWIHRYMLLQPQIMQHVCQIWILYSLLVWKYSLIGTFTNLPTIGPKEYSCDISINYSVTTTLYIYHKNFSVICLKLSHMNLINYCEIYLYLFTSGWPISLICVHD